MIEDVWVGVEVRERVAVRDLVFVPVLVYEIDGVPVWLELGVPVGDEEGVPVWLELGVPVGDEEGVPVCDEEDVRLAAGDAVGVELRVSEEVSVPECEAVIDEVELPVMEEVSVPEYEAVIDEVELPVMEEVSAPDCDAVIDEVATIDDDSELVEVLEDEGATEYDIDPVALNNEGMDVAEPISRDGSCPEVNVELLYIPT